MSKKNQQMSLAELREQLAEAQAKNAELAKENRDLRQNKRPNDALVLTGNITFPKGTGRSHLGAAAGQTIRDADGDLVLHIVGAWKESGSGNCTARITGWIDPRRVSLASPGKVEAAKATQSFKDQVVNKG